MQNTKYKIPVTEAGGYALQRHVANVKVNSWFAMFHNSLYLDQNEGGPGATPETHPDVCEFAAPQLQPPALTPAMAEKL